MEQCSTPSTTAPPRMAACAGGRAPYATRPEASRGRQHGEQECPTRSPFQRDRDRIIHSAAFRRMKFKTQVFIYHEGDYFRTRLTHSLEVAQIARSICRSLGLDEDLAEAVSLAHDLGHTPFGHAGEEVLNNAMARQGGFDHNEQGLKLLTRLEERYADFDGLNLTWETLEGLVKHNGPLDGPHARVKTNAVTGAHIPPYIEAFCRDFDLELASFPGPEAQIAALSDDIAYNNHDIDDGLRAGLFSIQDLADVPLAGPVFAEVSRLYPGIEPTRHIHEAIRRMIGRMVADLAAETSRRLAVLAPRSVEDIRAAGEPVAAFSEPLKQADRALKAFLFERMYRHYRVNRVFSKAKRVVQDLFDLFLAEPNCLPPEWQKRAGAPGDAATARTVADYIADMTDRAALAEYERLFEVDVR